MKSRRRKILARAGLAVGMLLLTGFFIALWFSPVWLAIDDRPVPADAIVVPGGDWVLRPKRAAELFKQGRVPRIIVSGKGEAEPLQLALRERGVPAAAIELENQARSTQENAVFVIRRLRQEKARRVIIVTSWFHSRRALHCFQHYAPEIEFYSVPAMNDCPKPGWLEASQRKWVTLEYAKLAWYWVRYGISPF